MGRKVDSGQRVGAGRGAVQGDAARFGRQRYLGTLAARLGNRARAAHISQPLGQLTSKYLRGGPAYDRACIAVVLGNRDEALLHRIFAEGYRGSAFAAVRREKDFESLRGYAALQELLKPQVSGGRPSGW